MDDLVARKSNLQKMFASLFISHMKKTALTEKCGETIANFTSVTFSGHQYDRHMTSQSTKWGAGSDYI